MAILSYNGENFNVLVSPADLPALVSNQAHNPGICVLVNISPENLEVLIHGSKSK